MGCSLLIVKIESKWSGRAYALVPTGGLWLKIFYRDFLENELDFLITLAG